MYCCSRAVFVVVNSFRFKVLPAARLFFSKCFLFFPCAFPRLLLCLIVLSAVPVFFSGTLFVVLWLVFAGRLFPELPRLSLFVPARVAGIVVILSLNRAFFPAALL